MPRTLRAWVITSLLAIAGGALADGDVSEARVLDEFSDGENWFLKGGSFRGEHFSPLSEINEHTVDELGLAWAVPLPSPDGISATPIVVDGVIYLSGSWSLVFAIDALTGRRLWTYDPDVRSRLKDDPYMSWPARVNRGVAVWHGKVLATTADCRLIALDAKSGREAWSVQTCDRRLGYAITDSPYVGGEMVFVGNSGSESGDKNRGYVSAYDVHTGELKWRFYTVPSDRAEENASPAMKMAAATWSGTALEEFGGGGSAWNEMTYDPESGLLFFGTAGALPYTHKIRSPDGGDNLFLSSVIAVNAETGEYEWHYQTVPQDSWDYNANMNIVLADLEIEGEPRNTLLIAPKNGFHYVLDRLTGELIAADKFAKVNWATHINLETGRPHYNPEAEYWNRADEAVAVWPNLWGAHGWNAMAYHPDLQLVYIPVIDIPSIITDYEDGDFSDTLELTTQVDGSAFDPGKLIAWDPVTNSERWTVRYDLPFNGGVLVTAGNLVFQGDAQGRFNAYRASDGKPVWTVATGSNITAAPVSYAIDGEQYVLVPVGAGGGVQFVYPELHAGEKASGPTQLMAFALGESVTPPPRPVPRPSLPEQPVLEASTKEIEHGQALYDLNCKGCHGQDAVARAGGSVPDLRYATKETHANWYEIVHGGARRGDGMPSFDLDKEKIEAMRKFVLSRSLEMRAD